MNAPRITVCTPTYNRAHTLRTPYDSLVAQTFQDFEWIVWDDGSTDDTPALLEALAADAPFAMAHHRADNQGKFSAVNAVAALARGELFLILDSDDALLPHALQAFVDAWTAWPVEERAGLMGLIANCQGPDGALWGTPLPHDRSTATYLDIRWRLGIRDEKCEALSTAALRACPYPRFPGEKHVPPGMIFARADRPFGIVHDTVRVYEILADGITAHSVRTRARNAEGYRTFYREVTEQTLPVRWRLHAAANFVRFSLHAGVAPWTLVSETRPGSARAAVVAMLGAGTAFWAKDRRALARKG